jgi:hypothetical protein
MKICVCCCTYKRPRSLGHLIRCFERQTHPDRFMVILDDEGSLGHRCGDRWDVVSIPRRFRTLGEKRNAVAALAPPDAGALAIWDDDDLYFPWALEATVAALAHGDWSRPSVALVPIVEPPGNRWSFRQVQTGGLFHGAWAYRRELFDRAGWYPAESGPEDQGLMRKMEALGPAIVDPIGLGYQPFYVYGGPRVSGAPNLSALGCDQRAYDAMGRLRTGPESPAIDDPPWFDLASPEILPGIHPRPF